MDASRFHVMCVCVCCINFITVSSSSKKSCTTALDVSIIFPRKINKALAAFHPICHHLHCGRVSFFLLPVASAIDESFVRHFHRCVNFISYYVFSFFPLANSHPSHLQILLFPFQSIDRHKSLNWHSVASLDLCARIVTPIFVMLLSYSMYYCTHCPVIRNVSINIKCQ